MKEAKDAKIPRAQPVGAGVVEPGGRIIPGLPEQRPARDLAVLDSQMAVRQVGAGGCLDGRSHLRVLEPRGHPAADLEPGLVPGGEIDPERIVGLTLAVEDGGLGRWHRKIGDGLANSLGKR